MPVDPDLVGRAFPAPAPLTVTEERVAAFAEAVRHPVAGDTVHLRVTGLVRAYDPAGSP